jgi:hypothetical protein
VGAEEVEDGASWVSCHLAKKQNKHTQSHFNDVCWFPSLKVSGPQASSLLDHPLKK